MYAGYLNENGHLNLRNFEKYLEKLAEVRCFFLTLYGIGSSCKYDNGSVNELIHGCICLTTHLTIVSLSSSSSASLQFDREHFSEVFVDLKWFESKVGNKYLNEAAGLAAEQEAASKDGTKAEVQVRL